MSEIIVLSKDEFTLLIHEISYKAGKASASEVLSQIEKQTDNDIIKEQEALQILDCGKGKLAKLRSGRKIVFYTTSRPFSYSRKSIRKYQDNLKVG